MGRRTRAEAQVGGPRDVRAGDDVRGVRRLLQARAARKGWCCATWPTRTRRCARTVPEELRTEELDDITEWLGELVRQVDSSLLDEWEQLAVDPADGRRGRSSDHRPAARSRRNVRAFRVLVRNAMFRRVELAALRQWDDARRRSTPRRLGRRSVARRDGATTSTSTTRSGTGPAARGPQLLQIERVSPAVGSCGRRSTTRLATTTGASAREVDLAASDAEGIAVVRVSAVDRW